MTSFWEVWSMYLLGGALMMMSLWEVWSVYLLGGAQVLAYLKKNIISDIYIHMAQGDDIIAKLPGHISLLS